MTETRHGSIVFLRFDETMVEGVERIGLRTECGLEFVLLFAVDDAVVHFHAEGIIEGLVVAADGVVRHRNGVFVLVVLVGVPVVGDGAVHETIVTAKGPEVGKAAVGDDEVLGLNGIEDGEQPVAALVFNDGVVDA